MTWASRLKGASKRDAPTAAAAVAAVPAGSRNTVKDEKKQAAKTKGISRGNRAGAIPKKGGGARGNRAAMTPAEGKAIIPFAKLSESPLSSQ